MSENEETLTEHPGGEVEDCPLCSCTHPIGEKCPRCGWEPTIIRFPGPQYMRESGVSQGEAVKTRLKKLSALLRAAIDHAKAGQQAHVVQWLGDQCTCFRDGWSIADDRTLGFCVARMVPFVTTGWTCEFIGYQDLNYNTFVFTYSPAAEPEVG